MSTDVRRRFVPAALPLAFWLAPVLVAAKAVHWGRPWESSYGWGVWLRDVRVSSHLDILFAVGFGFVAAALLTLTRRWPSLQRLAGLGLLGLGAFSALYAVASVTIFDYLRSPLTYPLLYLAGDMKAMRSSIGSFVTAGNVSAVLLAAGTYVAAVLLSSRALDRTPVVARRVMTVVCLLAAAGVVYTGHETAEGDWSDRPDVLILQNPHWEFLASVAEELRGGAHIPAMADDFPPEFLNDFRAEAGNTPVRVASSGAPSSPKNLVLVVLESTGAQYLSLYGSRYPTTPNLGAAAAHALVFDNFYANVGFTANSMAALSLSVYPYMTWREYTQEYPDYPGDTMANLLQARGYRTAFLSSSYLDYVGIDRFLKNRGFGEILDWKALGGGNETTSWGGNEGVLVDRAVSWIDRDRKKPFHLMLWTQQSHHPYEPTPGQKITDFFAGGKLPPDDYDLGRYLNTLAEVDRQLGRLFAALKERGLDKDTIVAVTGDHGEAFGQPHRTWGHGFRLYQEGIHVPLMIWSPALYPVGRRVATIGGHVDLNPTLAELMGIPPSAGWEGRSLFAADRNPRAYFYAANDDYLLGLRQDAFKYIYNVTRAREELYDLSRDPDEQTNVAPQNPELCHVLRQRLAAWKSHAARSLAVARGEKAPS